MSSHIKTYDGSEDLKDHLKIFQAAAKTEHWAMPTWCHMFNSTLTKNARVWFNDLPKESIESYDDLRKAFLENYLQQKKAQRLVEIHNIKQREGESTEEFVRRYKLECRDVVDEMMRVTMEFLRGEVAASNRQRKKSFLSWKQQEAGLKQNFKKGNFRNQQRTERKQDRFTLLTKTPKEILALDKGKFKPPPPMTTPVEKRNASKFCEFHGEVGHTTDECMHLKRQIEEMLKAKKLSHLIKELKQNNRKDQTKAAKKGETPRKDKSLAILMSVISFPPLGEEDGTEGPMIIEAEIGGHCVHRIAQIIPLECSMVSESGVPQPVINRAAEEKIQVAIHPEYPEQTVAISSTLTEEGKEPFWGTKWTRTDLEYVLHLPSPKCLKDVQKLNGKLASLNRFLSKSAEKSLPFFKTLKKCTKKSDFQWTAEAEMAFKQMKQLIVELPMLVEPKEKEELIMYLAAVKEAISAVLMTERDGRQVPIYFVSRALQGPEINYTPMEKLILALVNFIIERPEDDTFDTPMEEGEELSDPWVLFADESSCIDGSGAGLIITNPEGMEFTYALRFRFNATNNEAEYEALIAGLWIAGLIGVQNLQANVDSKLVANQMTPIYEYLTEGILPEEKRKARAVRRKEERYAVINKTQYKKSFLGLWLRCVGPLQENYVLREIHEGSCNTHSGPRSMVAKALRLGYYWPTMHTDARDLIRGCSDCQVHRPVPKNPQEKLTPITSPWPFYKWEINIARPFPEGPDKVKFLIVAMDYFTKWIESKPMATITGAQVKKFVWDNVVCRFSLSKEMVSDNERANRSLGDGIKARLGEHNKNWVKEISHVLWAHRTMIKSSNGETPFSLTYGAEAVIPVEIGMPTLRTAEVDMIKNNEALGINLDLLEEKREQAAIQEARSKAKMEKYYNARVRSTSFRPGDLVYQSNEASHAEDGGKLRPKWEGPYEVKETLGRGAYKLRDRNGNTLP
ncbi:reverse transcriptase domain-containing protein [Tanacetum coccineum]